MGTKKKFRAWILISFILAFTVVNSGWAARKVADEDDDTPPPAPSHAPPSHLWFSYFQINMLFGLQDPTAYEYTGEISWNPTICFSDSFCLRGNFGIAPFKNQNATNTTFLMDEAELLGAFWADGGFLELGGGVQNWANNGGARPVVSGNLGWPFRNAGPLDRIFVGYSACFSFYEITHEIKFGIGVAF